MQPNKKYRLLVVDDEPDMLRSLKRILVREGYDVDLAESGTAESEQAYKNIPDGILMDIKMPDISGIEAYRKVREICPDSFVVFMTAYSDLIKEADAEMPIEIINKPIDISNTLAVIKKAFCSRPILIVDDNIDYCQSLTRILKNRGFEVRSSYDVTTALESYCKCPRAIVLLDMALDGKNGLEVLQQIKEQNANGIVFLFSGFAEMEDKMKLVIAKLARFSFTKPLDIDQVIDSIESVILNPSKN